MKLVAIFKYMSFIMVILYLLFGFYILTLGSFLSPTQRWVGGILLILYGLYRAFKVYKLYVKKDDEQ